MWTGAQACAAHAPTQAEAAAWRLALGSLFRAEPDAFIAAGILGLGVTLTISPAFLDITLPHAAPHMSYAIPCLVSRINRMLIGACIPMRGVQATRC